MHEWQVAPCSMVTEEELAIAIRDRNEELKPEDVLGKEFYLYDISQSRFIRCNSCFDEQYEKIKKMISETIRMAYIEGIKKRMIGKIRNNRPFAKKISVMCPQCLRMVDIPVTRKEYRKYQRAAIKNQSYAKSIPRLSAGELALLDGNMCADCFQRIFGESI